MDKISEELIGIHSASIKLIRKLELLAIEKQKGHEELAEHWDKKRTQKDVNPK
jgi:hypothetical protein